MNTQENISPLSQFRQDLYSLLPRRRDALLELLDALSSSPNARSPVELSLSPLFRREYGSVRAAISGLFQASKPEEAAAERRLWEQQVARLIGRYLAPPRQQPFWLLGIDTVPIPRLFAPTLGDRQYVYQPNALAGHKPVTLGHRYSVLAYLPEPVQAGDPPWVVPLIVRRVTSDEKVTTVGAEQLCQVLQDQQLPFQGQLTVQVADRAYSGVEYLGRVSTQPNLVTVTRASSKRVFYRQAPPVTDHRPRGHPTWYGTPFHLQDPTSWGPADLTAETTFTTRQGRTYRVRLQGWRNLVMRGKRDLPMQRQPFTLVRVVVVDEQGVPVFAHDLWLIVMGARRDDITLLAAWQAYNRRYDLEHFFRFGKQRLLMAAFQTPEVAHEENWLQIVQLASVQLWLGRTLAHLIVRPWERYLPYPPDRCPTPSQVQRDWAAIIRQIGTPAQPPKRRGKSPGRAPGWRPPHRPRQTVVKKAT